MEYQKKYWIKYAFRSFENKKRRKPIKIHIVNDKVDVIAKKEKRVLTAPSIMDLKGHYDETVTFFNELRALCPNQVAPFKIDFTNIKTISPAAALIFTAEIDRLIKTRLWKKRSLSVKDFKKWDISVRLQLRDMGMFELLKTQKIPIKFWKKENHTDEIFLKFQSGNMALGGDVRLLKQLISKLTVLPKDKQLQAGLTEAMTNSIHHAYPEDYLMGNLIKDKLWWMSASVNLKSRFLTVMFYDEGVGIPKTLPKTFPEAIKSITGIIKDGDIIKAATAVKRTSTKQPNRGRGLKEIKNYIDSLEKERASLEIYSLKGYYKYQNKNEYILNNERKIEGTFIQWRIPI